VEWEFLSLMIPDWSFVAFVGFGLLSAYIVFSRKNA
ncbi:MAG TPA: disulfide bond formation protein B, partial [Nitrosomonas sp.]|nr:disulfide bond formation protein B [Nitrosomonas sp.]